MKKIHLFLNFAFGAIFFGLFSGQIALAISGPMAPVGPKMYFGSTYNSSRPIHFEPQYLYPNASRVQLAYDDPEDDWSYKFFQIHFIPLNQEVGLGIIQTVNDYWPYIDNLILNKSYKWEVRACAYRGNGNCNSNCQSTDRANSICQWTSWSSPSYSVYTPPQIPSNLRSSNISQNSVTLYWNGTPGSTYYNVKIWKGHLATRTNRECGKDEAPIPDFYLQNVSSGVTVNGLLAGTEYTWSVQSGHNNYYYKPSGGWGSYVSWNCLLRPENTAYFTTSQIPPTRYACNTSTWQCYQSSTGQYASLADCQANCQAPPTRYACNTSTWQCYASTYGQYNSLADCQANCQQITRYNCNNNTWQCYASLWGQYATLADCQANCQAPPTRYACNTSTWQCYQSSTGQYASLADCQANCQAPPTRYACNTSTWQCYASLWGQYASLADCQANCQAPVRYACNTSSWQCYASTYGQYNSLADCQANCQQITRYNCNNNTWQCYASLWGQYATLADCQANCQAPPTRYACNTSTWQCYTSTYGQYNSLADCQANCQPATRPPTVDLTVYPSTIYSGQSALLSWYSNYATSCYASSGWSGTKALSGSETVWPNQTTTYTITCYGPGGSAIDTVTVNVLTQYTTSGLDITKLGRNLSAGQNYYAESVNVKNDEVIEFWIRVANSSNNTALNVVVKDSLPAGLRYYPNSTKVDGQSWADGITTTGISLGNLVPGASRVITFQAIQESNTSYVSAYNIASIEASNFTSNSSRCLVNHQAVLGAATVATGPTETLALSLALAGLVSLIGFYYFSRHPRGRLLAEKFRNWRAEIALKKLSRKIS